MNLRDKTRAPRAITPIAALGVVVLVVLVTLTVGWAPLTHLSPSPSSRLSLFSGTPNSLLEQLTSPNAQKSGQFGDSIAVSGTTVAVGASTEKVGLAKDAGSVYLFNTVTKVVTTLTSPTVQNLGFFGDSVAISGATLVVGALGEYASGKNTAGHAYLFNVTTGALISTLTSPKAQKGGDFGTSVAISGKTVVVGAPNENASGHVYGGHVYTFSVTTGNVSLSLTSPNPQVNGLFGDSVAVGGSTIVVGAPQEASSGMSDAGKVYTFSASTGSLISTLGSPNPSVYGLFGLSVAATSSTVVVGAYDETSMGLAGAGNAYTFNAKTGNLSCTLTSPNALADGGFGWSVAIYDQTVVVGAARETASGLTQAGSAYSFIAPWADSINGSFISPNAQMSGYFGDAVAISGTTVVVGAPLESAKGHTSAGHAYVFDNSPLSITSPGLLSTGNFGISVAISGSTLVVGAPYETASGKTGGGHAYIINTRTGLVWTLTSPNVQQYGDFGFSVGISGSVVVVGAFGESAAGNVDAGHAYTFNATTGVMISKLTSANPQTNGDFGASVAISGATILVGAPYENASGHLDAGHAYKFNASTGKRTANLTSPNAQLDGLFGYAVGVTGTTLAVGAPLEMVSGSSGVGHAYGFLATTNALAFTLTSPNAQASGYFGCAIASAGKTLAVGAYGEAAGTLTSAGNAYVYNDTTGHRILTLTSPNAQAYGNFGQSVGIDGGLVLVGAPDETGASNVGAGHAYTFDLPTGTLNETLTSPDAQPSGDFGESSAGSGTTIVFGAPTETASGQAQAGHVYVF
jgi:hypothetical protein